MVTDILSSLTQLKPLDLSACATVGEIVGGMSDCAFGARMLGDVAATLVEMVRAGGKDAPVIIYDGRLDSKLGKLLIRLVERGWFRDIVRPEQFAGDHGINPRNVLVVGRYPERYEDEIFRHPQRTIFVNSERLCKPGQVQDGFFPDVVFADPRFVIPVLKRVLEERLEGVQTDIPRFMQDLSHYGGLASEVALASRTLRHMADDRECTVFLTLSGAMTVAKMQLVICDLIDLGLVKAIASTGALMAHGLVEGIGDVHYKYDPRHDDEALAALGLNRVTDSLEPETNFDHLADMLDMVLDPLSGETLLTPTEFHRLVGEHLIGQHVGGRGILKSAFSHSVPVFTPAFVDSEIGNDMYVHNRRREREGRPPIIFNLERDSELLVRLMTEANKLGIISVGGGTPRNYFQNGAPLIEIIRNRLGLDLPMKMYTYGCRICPDPMDLGHLSGCTYPENGSWRKMDLAHGRFTEVHGDATMILPFLVKYVLSTRNRSRSGT